MAFIGITYVKMDENYKAIEAFERSLKLKKDSPSIIYYLASMYGQVVGSLGIFRNLYM